VIEPLELRCLLSGSSAPELLSNYGAVPLCFELNQGQAASQVDFLAHGTGYGLYLSAGEAVLDLSKTTRTGASAATSDVVTMTLTGASSDRVARGLDRLPGTSNYLIGSDPSQWHLNIANYGQVEYQNVYTGVNLLYYGNQQSLEYDFQIAPGANPGVIQLAFTGPRSLSLDVQGNLVLGTSGGDLVEKAPVIYQQNGTERESVTGRYLLEGGDRVGFAVGAYDESRPLIIDPILSYSTYFGGSGTDVGASIAVDASGNAYITGSTASSDFPATNPLQPIPGGGSDVFVAKLSASGTSLVYSTYLGGNGDDIGMGLAVDAAGNVCVTGNTKSTNFPAASPLQPVSGGGTDAFVAKLNASGTALIFSTYLGGSGNDYGTGIAMDQAGEVYVVGYTTSINFPIFNAGQSTFGGLLDAFVTKLSPSGTALIYSTYFGGNGADYGTSIAVDAAGNACFTGETYSSNFPVLGALMPTYGGNGDAFVAKLTPLGTSLIYSTYLGGSSFTYGTSVAMDGSGNAYVTGQTYGSLPIVNALQPSPAGNADGFVTELNAAGTSFVYSTYLGGSDVDYGTGIAVDTAGNAYVAGYTQSGDFPTVDTPESSFGGGVDAFVAKVTALGSGLAYSTYLGGSGLESSTGIAVDTSGNAYVTGYTQSNNFPTSSPLQPGLDGTEDAFVAKLASSPLSVLGASLTPVVAALFTGTVATLVPNESKASNFTALVSWGDSSSSVATLVPFSGAYSVVGSHTYANAGTYGIVVTVQDSNGDTVTGTSLAKVSTAPLIGVARTVSFSEATSASVVVAAFKSADPTAFSGRFTATIVWGDGGQSTTGTIVADGAGFDVMGSHAYAIHGTYTMTITINAIGGGSVTVKSTATVDYPALIGGPRDISVFGALSFSGVVATFLDSDQTQNPNRYRAVITWPDTKTTSTVTPTTTSTPGQFAVSGAHTFGNFTGTLTLLVVVTDLQSAEPAGGFRTVTIESRVSDPPIGQVNQGYVTQLYRDLLQRQPDVVGLTYWGGLLDQGVSPQQVARQIIASQEYEEREVRELYATYLHRAADNVGLTAFTLFLSSGGSIEQAAALIVASPEYDQNRAGGNDTGFVAALYGDALLRAPDAHGQAMFTQALASGMSRAQAAMLILGSPEYQQTLVRGLFVRYLQREVDPIGLGDFTTALANGATKRDVLSAILGSDEYFANSQDT
jgi:hypothetical protein